MLARVWPVRWLVLTIDGSATARKEVEMMNLNIGDGQIPSRKERNSPT